MSRAAAATPAVAPAEKRLSRPATVLAVLLVIFILNYIDRFLISGLVEHIKDAFALGDGFMGLLMGPAFALFFSLLSIPIARIADVRSRVTVIALGCLLWSAGTICSGLAAGPWTLALARVAVGIGEAAFTAPAYSLLSSYFPAEKRGRAFGIFMLAIYFGQVGGYVLGPVLADAYSWRFAFILMGIPGIFMGILEYLVIREPRQQPAPQPPFLPLLGKLLSTPTFLLAALGMGAGTFAGVAFGLWGPTLFARVYGLPMRTAATAYGTLTSLAAFIGAILFGIVADRVGKKGMHRVLLLAAASLAIGSCIIFGIIWAPDFTVARLLLLPSGILGGGYAVGIMAILQYLLPDSYRATATAIFSMGTMLIGFVAGPWLAGLLSEALGNNASSLRWALTLVEPVALLGALLFWRAARHLATDHEALSETGPLFQPAEQENPCP